MEKIKNLLSLAAAGLIITGIIACGSDNKQNNQSTDSTASAKVIPPPVIPETTNYYPTKPGESIICADPVTYDVIFKNYTPEDSWTDECLANLNSQSLINAVFQNVYKGKLTATDYYLNTPLPIDSVKKLETLYTREQIGKVQFVEDWYYDQDNCTMYKKVKSLTFGYELLDENGRLRGFRVAFKVNFNNNESQDTKADSTKAAK